MLFYNYTQLQLTIGACLRLFPFPSWTTSVFHCGWLVNFFAANQFTVSLTGPLCDLPRLINCLSLSLILRPTVSRPVCLGIKHPSGAYDQFLLLSDNCGFDVGKWFWREDGSVIYNCSWPSPAQSFSCPSPVGLVTIFYCLRFETSLFVASYDSQGYGGGI
jgi:hypothetical protein